MNLKLFLYFEILSKFGFSLSQETHNPSLLLPSVNCSSSMDPYGQGPPKITISSQGILDLFPSNETVELVQDSGYQRRYFECSHHTPVDWIMEIHPSTDLFRVTRSFYQRRGPPSNKGPSDPLLFSSYMVFLYKNEEFKKPTLALCQTSCGLYKYLEILPGKFSPAVKVQGSPSTKDFASLADKLIASSSSTSLAFPQPRSCDINLVIQVTQDEGGSRLFYKWAPSNNQSVSIRKEIMESSLTTSDQGVYFRNAFRLIKQEPQCLKFTSSSSCQDCKEVEPHKYYSDEESYLNSALFYARASTGTKLAFRGVFTVTRPRQFYFEHNLPLKEMMDFDPPRTLYVGFEVEFRCNVSTIYFAYGTLIYIEEDLKDMTEMPVNLGEFEKFTPEGHREVVKKMNFTSGNITRHVTCSAPLWNWSERVTKTFQVEIEYAIPPQIIQQDDTITINEVLLQEGQENITLECKAYGNPRPRVTWITPHQNSSSSTVQNDEDDFYDNQQEDDEGTSPLIVNSTLKIFKASQPLHQGTYLCIVENIAGRTQKTFHLQFPQSGLSFETKLALSSSLGVLVFLGLTTLLLIYRRIIMQRHEYRTKTAQAIKEFREGIKKKAQQGTVFSTVAYNKDKKNKKCNKAKGKGHEEDEPGGIDIMDLDYDPDKEGLELPNMSVLELPYDDRFEVEQSKFQIEDKMLGQGAYGFVRKGTVTLSNGKDQVVAIKMLKSSVDIDDFKGFLTELKIMAYIGFHPNIVSLVAACTQNIDEREVMIAVELCVNGSLQEYLQEKQSMFQPLDPSSAEANSRKTYANLFNPMALTELDLYTWSYQIVSGMEFLESKQVLHGDLAARNVLLTADKTAKIGDFGLSRVLMDSKNYTKKSRVPLPWKWMALESLKFLRFSTASDVWAYGVTLWEIYSLGEVPYAGLSFGPEFIGQVENGFRLGKPGLATDYLYNIMKHCWNPDPEDRVTFGQLKVAFTEILDLASNPGQTAPDLTMVTPSRITLHLQHSPIAQPRRLRRINHGGNNPNANHPNTNENWYSNRRTQIPNLYLNV